jgi:hypothetical protein
MRSALHRVPNLSLLPRDGRGVNAEVTRFIYIYTDFTHVKSIRKRKSDEITPIAQGEELSPRLDDPSLFGLSRHNLYRNTDFERNSVSPTLKSTGARHWGNAIFL